MSKLNGVLTVSILIVLIVLVVNACQVSKTESARYNLPPVVTLEMLRPGEKEDIPISERFLPSELKFTHSLVPNPQKAGDFSFATSWTSKPEAEVWNKDTTVHWYLSVFEESNDKSLSEINSGKRPQYGDVDHAFAISLPRGKHYVIRVVMELAENFIQRNE